MPRPLRIHVPGAFYHVTLRVNHRQNIFFTPDDRRLFECLIAEVLERFTARLHAFCLMTNHVHLLIQVGDVPLGRLMLRIAGRYARTVQSQLHTTGHLFEKRYYSILVDADEYLLELLRYIHLNPVRAHMVIDPSATDFALRLFHPERDRAISAYQRFISQESHLSASSPLSECNPNDRRILGSDNFAARLLSAAWRPRSRKTLADLIGDACRQFSVTTDSLFSSSHQRHLTHVRAWIAHQALILRIASLSGVARTFHRSEASLRESVRRHFNYP